ncbi:hypothetical protein Leryth_018250 [Lithospermum erythrorhizon]|nr:hypothetical protein Leryth_018250 [Lithospermum erythrorhizon]
MEVELATSQLGFVQEDMDKDAKFSDSELVFYVKNVLKLSIQGDCRSYNELVSVIEHNQSLGIDEVAVLVTCLKALSGAVSCIHMVHHRRLINSISCMSLWNYETDVMDALVELLLSLASSGGQLDMCLSMLVDNFVPPHDPVRILNEPRARTRKSRVLERVHSTLKDIADLVPLSPMRLEEIVIERMPKACSTVNTEVMVRVCGEHAMHLKMVLSGKSCWSAQFCVCNGSL